MMHGSDHVIKKPDIRLGKENNDCGRGFYCTRELEMAKEWACKQNCDGFANIYDFDMAGLKTLDLLNGEYTILNWIALLLKNRTFSIDSQIGLDAREYLIENFLSTRKIMMLLSDIALTIRIFPLQTALWRTLCC